MLPTVAIPVFDRRIDTTAMRIGDTVGALTIVRCELCDQPAIRWGRKGKALTVYAHIIDVTDARGKMRTWCEFPDRARKQKRVAEQAQAPAAQS